MLFYQNKNKKIISVPIDKSPIPFLKKEKKSVTNKKL